MHIIHANKYTKKIQFHIYRVIVVAIDALDQIQLTAFLVKEIFILIQHQKNVINLVHQIHFRIKIITFVLHVINHAKLVMEYF